MDLTFTPDASKMKVPRNLLRLSKGRQFKVIELHLGV